MAFTFTPNAWDSNFFGYPVATISGEGSADDFGMMYQRLKQEVKLAYWFADPAQKEIAEKYGGKYIDTRITICIDLEKVRRATVEHVVIEQQITPSVRLLLFECAQFSRFHKDKRFSESQVHELYSLWLEKAANENRLLVYKIENEVRGFAVVNMKHNAGWFELMAVDQNFRRRGIGRALSHAVINYASEKNCEQLFGHIHSGNESVWHLHQQTGFRRIKEESIYHFWL